MTYLKRPFRHATKLKSVADMDLFTIPAIKLSTLDKNIKEIFPYERMRNAKASKYNLLYKYDPDCSVSLTPTLLSLTAVIDLLAVIYSSINSDDQLISAPVIPTGGNSSPTPLIGRVNNSTALHPFPQRPFNLMET